MNTQHNSRRNKYWATSKSMHRYKSLSDGYWIEYNPNIKQYRINHNKGVPLIIMGYNPHVAALEEQFNKYNRLTHRKEYS